MAQIVHKHDNHERSITLSTAVPNTNSSRELGNAGNAWSQLKGKVNNVIVNATADGSSVMTSELNKTWRAAILRHRVTHRDNTGGSSYANAKVFDSNYDHHILGIGTEGYATLPGQPVESSSHKKVGLKEISRRRHTEAFGGRFLLKQVSINSVQYDKNGVATADITQHAETIRQASTIRNDIIIYNIEASPYQRVIIQNRPNKVEFKGETTWASIKSMGRNTPLYHYTGSEDIVQFNISWYCNDPDHPEEVIDKCRFLEAWTKSDGYKASPPVLRIQWGSSGIFDNQTFILTSATYTLQGFNNGFRKFTTGHDGSRKVDMVDGKLYPSYATQELIFKRVSATNLTYEDILPKNRIPAPWSQS